MHYYYILKQNNIIISKTLINSNEIYLENDIKSLIEFNENNISKKLYIKTINDTDFHLISKKYESMSKQKNLYILSNNTILEPKFYIYKNCDFMYKKTHLKKTHLKKTHLKKTHLKKTKTIKEFLNKLPTINPPRYMQNTISYSAKYKNSN